MNISAISGFNTNCYAKKSKPAFSAGAVTVKTVQRTVMSKALEKNLAYGWLAMQEFLLKFDRLISPAATRCKHLAEGTAIYGSKKVELEAMEAKRKGILLEALKCNSLPEKCKALEELVKKENIADSFEQSVLLVQMLNKRLENAVVGCLGISHNKGPIHGKTRMNDAHGFVLYGADKGADLSNPSTWGTDAVVIDTVNKIVLPAKEGLEAIIKSLNLRSFEKAQLF